MRRFFVTPENFKNNSVEINDEEFHHLRNVCRLTEGERIELLDGQGNLALAQIEKIGKKSAQIKILERSQLPQLKPPHIKVFLCLPKFQTMDLIVQKLVELGVAELTPVLSERSFLKKKSKDLSFKINRWNKIALEACKQSGRGWPMQIGEVLDLNTAIKKVSDLPALFLYEGDASLDIKAALSSIIKPQEIGIFIGSEGGFSPKEVELFQSHGLKPLTVGDLVLRVETACIAVCSVIKYHFDLMK